MSTVALYMPNPERLAWWADHLSGLLPEHRVLAHHDVTDPAEVRYAVVWKPPKRAGSRTFPNLAATVSVGAGHRPHRGRSQAIPRMFLSSRRRATTLTQRMREYVALHVLRHHRELPRIERMRETRDYGISR